jgi:hypothetical protein
MTNPTNPIEEAKALKATITKIISEFRERTTYLVTEIEIQSTSHKVNRNGRSYFRIADTELTKLTVASADGSKVEV